MSASEGNHADHHAQPGHDHGSASHGHGAHDGHHGHAAPALPEPKTPMWLPALGGALFLLVGLIWGLSPSPSDADAGTAGGAAAGGGAATGDAGAAPASPH